jgi:hypothetical protein
VAQVDTGYLRDWHGREVLADWESLRHSRMVMIQADAQHKRYQGSQAHLITPSKPATEPARSV